MYVIIGFYRLWSPTIQMETRLLVKKDELWRKDPLRVKTAREWVSRVVKETSTVLLVADDHYTSRD